MSPGGESYPPGSNLAPAYLRGALARTPIPRGPGFVTRTTAPPFEQAAVGRQAPAGTCRHSGGRASSSAPEPVWRAARLTAEAGRLGGPAQRDQSPPSPTGPLTTTGAGGSRRAARCLRMERGGAGGAWREQVPTSRGPIRGPKYYPHHGSDGQAHWVWGPGPVRTMMAWMPAVRAKAGRTPGRWTDAGEVSGTPWYDSDPS